MSSNIITCPLAELSDLLFYFARHKEMDIRIHIPNPYWNISADFEKNGT